MKPPVMRFASHPFDRLWGHATAPGSRPVALVVFTAALLALSFAVWQHTQVRAQFADAAARAKTVVAAPKSTSPGKPSSTETARLVAIDRAARQLNTPWPAVFDAIEANVGAQVALLAIEPDAVQGRLRLELESRRLPLLLEFAQQLDQSPAFEQVTLARHELEERDPGAPYRMVIDATLRGAPAQPGSGKP